VQTEKFCSLAPKAESLIETYPSQAQFVLRRIAYFNQLQNNSRKAKDYLEMGMDYVVENKELEINFKQLGEAYNGLGDFKKDLFFSKTNH
jgi:hypothetical protein